MLLRSGDHSRQQRPELDRIGGRQAADTLLADIDGRSSSDGALVREQRDYFFDLREIRLRSDSEDAVGC
jgi:hypothetical protein